MVFRCPNIQAHDNEALIYLNFGTPKNNEFSILGVPILKHIRVFGYFRLNGPLRQYFSLYQVVSQGEAERKEK